MLNASKRFLKGKPKNYLPEEQIRAIAALYQKGEVIEGELAVISTQEAEKADYNLSPSRWTGKLMATEINSIRLVNDSLNLLKNKENQLAIKVEKVCALVKDDPTESSLFEGKNWDRVGDHYQVTKKPRNLDMAKISTIPFAPMEAIPLGGEYAPHYIHKKPSEITSGTYVEKGDILVAKITPSFENGKQALIVNLPSAFGYATTEVIPLHPVSAEDDRRLLFFYLLHPEVRRFVAERMEGATGRQRVPENVLLDLPFPKLSPKVQTTISDLLEMIQQQIDFCNKKRAVLEELSKSLLHKLMTGEISVEDLDLSALTPEEPQPKTEAEVQS